MRRFKIIQGRFPVRVPLLVRIRNYSHPACSIIFVFLMLLSFFYGKPVMAKDGIENIEIIESSINFSQNDSPRAAYLYLDLKNNGDKKVANLNLEVTYYDADGYLIKRSVLKNKLTEEIPPGEIRKYKIRLRGDVVNVKHEEYPYSQQDKVGEFDVMVASVKFARK